MCFHENGTSKGMSFSIINKFLFFFFFLEIRITKIIENCKLKTIKMGQISLKTIKVNI